MIEKRVAAVIFDIGGTTIEDSADVAKVFASALGQHGIDTSTSMLRKWRGGSKRQIIEQLVRTEAEPSQDPAAVYETFQNSLVDAFRTRGIVPISGIETAFTTLRENHVHVVLCTGFDARVTSVIIEHLGWARQVDGVVTSDDVKQGRPEPDLLLAAMRRVDVTDPAAVVSVGDTENDLRAAAAAGVGVSIGVLTGAHGRQQLVTVPHTVILPSAAQVAPWLADRRWAAA